MEIEDAARVAEGNRIRNQFGVTAQGGSIPEIARQIYICRRKKHEIHVCYRCGKKVTFPMIVGSRMQSAISVSDKVICSRSAERISSLSQIKYVAINSISDEATTPVPKQEIQVRFKGLTCTLELDTAAGGRFLSVSTWEQLGGT